MAGRPAFEAPGINSDLRIRNRTTPPKISLQYVVKDGAGKVVTKGSELLINPNYQWNVSYQGTDELYSEKALLRSWILSLPRRIQSVVTASLMNGLSHLFGRGFTTDIAGSRSPAKNGFNGA